MTDLTMTEAAIVAAAQASEAVAELLRYAREGDYNDRAAFGETEPTPKLAEALKLAIEIEIGGDAIYDAEEREQLEALHVAVGTFIEGWIG